jgi:undecaprenyl-diphosphatase
VIAVLVFFRRDLWSVARGWLASLWEPSLRRTLDARMGWYLIVGTIPISVFGLAFEGPIENGARSLYLIGAVLIVFALVMLVADRFARLDRSQDQVTLRDAVVVGGAQALALVPGVSRAGATITAGLFLGLNRTVAARFSFLSRCPRSC